MRGRSEVVVVIFETERLIDLPIPPLPGAEGPPAWGLPECIALISDLFVSARNWSRSRVSTGFLSSLPLNAYPPNPRPACTLLRPEGTLPADRPPDPWPLPPPCLSRSASSERLCKYSIGAGCSSPSQSGGRSAAPSPSTEVSQVSAPPLPSLIL